MGIAIHPARLRYELARRALSATDLARLSGVSGQTIAAALAGRSISTRSLRRMASALMNAPTVAVIDDLLGRSDVAG